jgi:hypothetical protein
MRVDVAGKGDGGRGEGDVVGDGSNRIGNVAVEPNAGGRLCKPDERHPTSEAPSAKVITRRNKVLNWGIEAGNFPQSPGI